MLPHLVFVIARPLEITAMDNVSKSGTKLSFEELQLDNEDAPQLKRGTDADVAAMTRMNKKQVLRVGHDHYRFNFTTS